MNDSGFLAALEREREKMNDLGFLAALERETENE